MLSNPVEDIYQTDILHYVFMKFRVGEANC